MNWRKSIQVVGGYCDEAYDKDGRLLYAFQPMLYLGIFLVFRRWARSVSLRLPLFGVIYPKDFHRFDDFARLGRNYR